MERVDLNISKIERKIEVLSWKVTFCSMAFVLMLFLVMEDWREIFSAFINDWPATTLAAVLLCFALQKLFQMVIRYIFYWMID